MQFVFRTLKHQVVLSLFCSYSIKALHYIGNVETLDRYQLGAPNSAFSSTDRMRGFEPCDGSSILSGPAIYVHKFVE